MGTSIDTAQGVDNFPREVSENYDDRELIAEIEEEGLCNEDAKKIAAAEVRDSVWYLLSLLRKNVSDEDITRAINGFREEYPAGTDLEAKLGSLRYGLEVDILERLRPHIYADLKHGEAIRRIIEESDIFDVGERIEAAFSIVKKLDELIEEMGLTDEALNAVVKYYVEGGCFVGEGTVKFFERLLEYKGTLEDHYEEAGYKPHEHQSFSEFVLTDLDASPGEEEYFASLS